jgi:hypothetical protein
MEIQGVLKRWRVTMNEGSICYVFAERFLTSKVPWAILYFSGCFPCCFSQRIQTFLWILGWSTKPLTFFFWWLIFTLARLNFGFFNWISLSFEMKCYFGIFIGVLSCPKAQKLHIITPPPPLYLCSVRIGVCNWEFFFLIMISSRINWLSFWMI